MVKENTKKDEWISASEFGKRIGRTNKTILDAISAGRFPVELLKERQTKTGKTRHLLNYLPAKKHWEESPATRGRAADPNYLAAKLRQQEADAKLSEMKAAKMAGELVDVQDVKTLFSKAAVNVREALLSQCSKVAPSLVGVSEVKEIENILLAAISETLEELSNVTKSRTLS